MTSLRPKKRLTAAVWALVVLAGYLEARGQDATTENAATRDYAVALGLENRQLYPQAAARWQKFIDAYKSDKRLDRANYHLATCQLQSGEAEKAVATYRNLLAAFPNFAARDAASFNLAMALYQIGLKSKKPDDLKAAGDAFAAVITTYPQSKQVAPALFYQGESLVAAGQPTAAVPLYEKLIAAYPAGEVTPQARFALGTLQQEAGQNAAAIATFQSFLSAHAQDPRVNEARLRLGLSLMAEKKYAEAAQSLAAAAAVADFALADLALLRQAQCLAEQNQIDAAVAMYQSLAGKFPKSKQIGPAQIAAGKLLYQATKYLQAQQALTPAVAAANDASPEAVYWLAKTLVNLNQAPAGLAEVEKAIQAFPNSNFLPWLRLGRIDVLYEMPDRRKETVALYQQFVRQHVDHELAPQAAYMGAFAALSIGDYADAHRQATAFLANPKWQAHDLFPDVEFVAAESLVLGGGANDPVPQIVKAEPLYRQIVEKFPKHRNAPASRVRIGLCLYLQKKYDAAITQLTQSLPQLAEPELAAEAQLLIGRSQRDAKRLPQAVAAFRESLRLKPDWARADETLLALAETLREDKKLDEATGELTRLLTTLPNSSHRPQAFYEVAEIAERQQKHDDAIRNYEAVLNQFATSTFAPPAAYGIAKARFAKDDFAGAVAGATVVVDRFGMSEVAPRARYLRGLAQQRLKQFQPAIGDFEAFIATKPPADDAHDARYAIALCQIALKQPDQAAASLKALLNEAPKYARADEAYYELGFALAEAKQDQAAADAWRTLAMKFPKSELVADAWFRVGEYHELKKEWEPARDAYQHGRQQAKTPELQEKLQFKLGWVQYQAEHWPQAAAAFQAQIQAFPMGGLQPDGTYFAGEALYRQKQYAPALERFNQAIAQKNEKYLARSLYRAGDCAAHQKQWAASEGHYQALVNQFPKFELISDARYGLGWAQQNQEKLPAAKSTYEQVTKETDTETAAKARFMMGECAFREKKYEEAVEHYLTASLGYPYEEWQALGYLEAGRCLLELKQNEKAREMFETVVTKYPKHPKAKDAEKLLATVKK